MIALAVTTCAEFLNEFIQTNYDTKADSNNSLNYFLLSVRKYNSYVLAAVSGDKIALGIRFVFFAIAEPKSSLLVTVLACVGTALLVSLVAVLFFVRYKAARKGRFTPETTMGLEMEVQSPENEDSMVIDRCIFPFSKFFMISFTMIIAEITTIIAGRSHFKCCLSVIPTFTHVHFFSVFIIWKTLHQPTATKRRQLQERLKKMLMLITHLV